MSEGEKQNVKSIEQKAEGEWLEICRKSIQPPPPLSQPLSFNLLTAISCFIGKRVLCVSILPPTIAGSEKKKGLFRGGGIWLFCYFLCM